MSIGNKILELRKKANYSQEELAEKLGVTRQTISKWELDETSPDIKQAKTLSKIFKISLDELVNNDIQNILIGKVSNTERLAGLIITILKIIGGFILFSLILLIVSGFLFTFIRKESTKGQLLEATIYCSIGENDYIISIGDDKYFDCQNCNKDMQIYLKDITDWANLKHSVENINNYFTDNGGSCE